MWCCPIRGLGAKLVAKAEAAEHQFPTLIHHTNMNFASKCGFINREAEQSNGEEVSHGIVSLVKG
jgi:hypothetical protein